MICLMREEMDGADWTSHRSGRLVSAHEASAVVYGEMGSDAFEVWGRAGTIKQSASKPGFSPGLVAVSSSPLQGGNRQ